MSQQKTIPERLIHKKLKQAKNETRKLLRELSARLKISSDNPLKELTLLVIEQQKLTELLSQLDKYQNDL